MIILQVRCLDFMRSHHAQTYRKDNLDSLNFEVIFIVVFFYKSCCMKTVCLFGGICSFTCFPHLLSQYCLLLPSSFPETSHILIT